MIAAQVIPNRFSQALSTASADSSGIGGSALDAPFIRRPTRGIELRDDTFATIRLVAAIDGKNQLLVDAGSRRKNNQQPLVTPDGKRATDIYSNFLLQQVQEERQEKAQILETFGEPYIFLFGERPRIITFQGILANTFDFNWEAEWWWNYDNYLRGTRCIEQNAQVFISYDNTLISGYIIASQSTKIAQERNWVSFQFTIFLTSYSTFSQLGNPYAKPGYALDPSNDPNFALSEQDSVDPATAAQFRPVLVPTTPPTVTPPASLFDAITANVQTVSDAWQKASDIVQNVLAGVSNILSGTTVRIPYGFAGTMAFDDSADSKLGTVGFGTPIKYSTFSDNADEYVGVGDHYGSSDVSLALVANLGFSSLQDQLNYNQEMVDKAATIWEDNGFIIPPDQLGTVSNFLVGQNVGLVALGASSSWYSTSPTEAVGSANPPFGAGLSVAQNLPSF